MTLETERATANRYPLSRGLNEVAQETAGAKVLRWETQMAHGGNEEAVCGGWGRQGRDWGKMRLAPGDMGPGEDAGFNLSEMGSHRSGERMRETKPVTL